MVVYRLIGSGAIEDKMFRLQIFKGGLSKTFMEHEQQVRFFTHKQLGSSDQTGPVGLLASLAERSTLPCKKFTGLRLKSLFEQPNQYSRRMFGNTAAKADWMLALRWSHSKDF